ncbi:hypothetical protein [Flavihumibacter fluvii]|uniref:hypothetical protein n=1 Tax=Flavihumibacter fluvii TaxID=2838157 RepID=UPI001BDDF9E9|nr:hypothetical protein [Flavihumibacter fluvii]ULQ51287.1 hypothetical protein KJS93_14445 [Flavihumibacter fluvii]
MQKILIISLLSIHLIGNTEFNQVLHIPVLAAHYIHHLQSGDTKSFPDFVSEHYGKGDNDPSDNQEEKNLPFMQVHQHAFSVAVIPIPEIITTITIIDKIQPKGKKIISFILPVGFFGSILKPPRTVA